MAPSGTLHTAPFRGWTSPSFVERLLLPLLGVEPHKRIVRLDLDPAHLVRHIHPAFRLEELRCGELRLVVGHVVKHVEEDRVWEGSDRLLREAFGFAHVVALRDPNVHLEAVIVIGVAQGLRGRSRLLGWSLVAAAKKHAGALHLLVLIARLERLLHQKLCVVFVLLQGSFRRKDFRGHRERRHQTVSQIPFSAPQEVREVACVVLTLSYQIQLPGGWARFQCRALH